MATPEPSATSHLVMACRPDGTTRPERRPAPRAVAGEVVLRTRVCGLCGTDLFKLANGTAPPGTVLGHELVGEVVEAGRGVERFRPGDRVVVPHHVACGECALCRRGADTQCTVFKENLLEPGGFAELVRVGERAVRLAMRPVPPHVTDAAASFLEPAACVLRGVRAAGLPGDGGCAVVLGGGSMGLLHLLVVRAVLPAAAVVVADPLESRRRLARELGAAAATGADPAELSAAVHRASAGVGADAVFDTVGGAGPARTGLELTRPGGALVLFAHAGDGERADFDLNHFFKREARLVATYSSGLDEQARVAELLFAGALDPAPLVTRVLPLAELERGVRLVRRREALKVLLAPEAG